MDTLTPKRWNALLAWLPAVLVVAASLLLWLADTPAQQALRNYQFDQFQRWRPRAAPAQPVHIVDIDEASLERLGQWPWPRSRMATLLDRLAGAGAVAVVFDSVFAEADRTAPKAVVDSLGVSGTQRDALLALPDPDASFARSLQQTPSVLGFALQQGGKATLPQQTAHMVVLGEAQPDWLHRFDGATTSLPALQSAAGGNGALNFVPDSDGVVRRVPLALRVGDATVPSLVTEALRVAAAEANVVLKSAGANSGLAEVRIGTLAVPSTPHGEMWLHYSRPVGTRALPAWQVLANPLPPGQLAGQIVLVGSSAQGLMDLRFSPLGLLPGVEVHAQALDQILSGRFLQRPSWARGLEVLFLGLGGVLVSVLALRQRAWVSATAGLGLLVVWLLGTWWAFTVRGLLLDALSPALVWLLCYLVCSLWHHLRTEREQRWVRQAFARYVSPNRVAYLLAHPKAMELGGRRQVCSFVFTDLAGFTSLVEALDPAQAVQLLNTYLDEMVAIAFRHEGTLDRIVGDAVAIMFSAPVKQADHRARALACALEMDAFASNYAAEQKRLGKAAFGQTRIGVHCGEVIVGNFGGKTVFDYRALGDAVNTCARLESTTCCSTVFASAANWVLPLSKHTDWWKGGIGCAAKAAEKSCWSFLASMGRCGAEPSSGAALFTWSTHWVPAVLVTVTLPTLPSALGSRAM